MQASIDRRQLRLHDIMDIKAQVSVDGGMASIMKSLVEKGQVCGVVVHGLLHERR